LDGFGPSEANLMNNGKLGSGGIPECVAATKFLGDEIISASRELMAQEMGFVLVGEDQIVHLEDPVSIFEESRPSIGSAFLLSKLTGGAFGRENGGGSHFDAQMPKDIAAAKPLSVLPPEMTPLDVPQEQALLERSKVGGGLVSDPFEGQGLGSGLHNMEATNNGKRSLLMVPDGNKVAVCKLEL
jgi:hypothetical protein